ncbi:MAG: hypothetical protein RL514_411 [Verrucomicrobiota bacterium]|jgi:DNA-binding NtrC family response regulator
MTILNLAPERLRVLLADADHDFYTKITLFLDEVAPRRFLLEWASSYNFAVTSIRRQRFDLCLVSSYVGHRSGGDLVRHIQANAPGLPVILLAGKEEMFETPTAQPVECLDRHGLSVEILRQAIRDTVFRTAGGVLIRLNLAQSTALAGGRAAA